MDPKDDFLARHGWDDEDVKEYGVYQAPPKPEQDEYEGDSIWDVL